MDGAWGRRSFQIRCANCIEIQGALPPEALRTAQARICTSVPYNAVLFAV